MIATPHSPNMTVEEYLVWEPQQELRYEYLNGEVVAMTGGTVPHNDIAINLLMALLPTIRANGCRINIADVKLQITSSSLYYYPDLIVSCDPKDLTARQFLQCPNLIVEVLSPGTADKDRSEKFIDYQRIPSLQEYLLINSERVSVECYRRGEGRMWLYYPHTPGDTLTLQSLDITVPIQQIYAGVQFKSNNG